MVFSNRFAKFGKGSELAAIMPDANTISIYYFLQGISVKSVDLSKGDMELRREKVSLGYSEVIPLKTKLVSRLDSNIGVIDYEKQ